MGGGIFGDSSIGIVVIIYFRKLDGKGITTVL